METIRIQAVSRVLDVSFLRMAASKLKSAVFKHLWKVGELWAVNSAWFDSYLIRSTDGREDRSTFYF